MRSGAASGIVGGIGLESVSAFGIVGSVQVVSVGDYQQQHVELHVKLRDIEDQTQARCIQLCRMAVRCQNAVIPKPKSTTPAAMSGAR